MRAYLPLLPVFGFALIFPLIPLIAGWFLRPDKPGNVKGERYECGIQSNEDIRHRFSVRFYIIAVIFIVFDVEVIFLIPWAVLFNKLALFGLIEMVIFILILFFAYIYAWKKQALEWV